MGYFSNNKEVNFDILKKSGIYSDELLNELQNFNYGSILKLLDQHSIRNLDFMEPLLYAVKNEYGTYKVYSYYGENLQEDLELAREIVIEEPELIEDTPISNNKQYILELAETNPKIVRHMSDTLKKDATFTERLCELNDKEVTMYVAKECTMPDAIIENPNLAENKEFMAEAVKQEARMLEHTSDKLKNDYDFIRETSKENYEVIDYVVNNTKQLELGAIRGAKDTTREFTINDCMKIIDELSEKSDDDRYKKVKEKIASQGVDDVRTMRWVTAMVAQSDEINPDMLKKVLDYSILTMSKIQKDLSDEGKEKVSIDNMQELITPKIVNKLKEKAIQQGIEIDIETERKIEEYTKFYNEYQEKLKEEKLKKIRKEDKYKPENIEKATQGASLEGVQKETEVIKTEIKQERENKTNPIGENLNDKSNDEKA